MAGAGKNPIPKAKPGQQYADRAKTNDSAYRQEALEQDAADPFGKRKIEADNPRKKVAKAGTIPDGEGMPGAKSSIETEAFEKARARIAKLHAGDEDHEF